MRCRYRVYPLNKSRCWCRCNWDVTNEYLTRAIFEKQLTALHVIRTFHRVNRHVFILSTKMWTETKTVPSTWYIFNVQECTHTDFFTCALYCYWLSAWGTSEFFTGKSVELLSWLAICLLFWWFISHLLGNYANINMWKSDHMKAWNCSRDDCPPSAPLSAPQTHTHTHQQKGHCLPNDFCPSYLQPHTTFFQFSSWRTQKFSYHATSWK